MEAHYESDSDTDLGSESEPDYDIDEDEIEVLLTRQLNLEPEPDAPITTEYPTHSSLIEQVRAQQANTLLNDLHMAIKDQAQIPTKLAYQKLYCT